MGTALAFQVMMDLVSKIWTDIGCCLYCYWDGEGRHGMMGVFSDNKVKMHDLPTPLLI